MEILLFIAGGLLSWLVNVIDTYSGWERGSVNCYDDEDFAGGGATVQQTRMRVWTAID